MLLFFLLVLAMKGSAQWQELGLLSPPNTVWTFTSSGDHLYAGTLGDGFFYSLDTGMTWTQSNTGLTKLSVRAIAAKDNIVITGLYGDICKSTDYGLTWVSRHNGIFNLDISCALRIGDSLYIGSYGGGVYLSVDDGENYLVRNNGLTDKYIKCMYCDGTRLYVGTAYGGGGIFISEDFGTTWTQKVNGVPRHPYAPEKYDIINSITSANGNVYAATYHWGIIMSEDYGELWELVFYYNSTTWRMASYGDYAFSGHDYDGVRRSTSNGRHWEQFNEGLDYLRIHALYMYDTYLFAGLANGYAYRRYIKDIITETDEPDYCREIRVIPHPVFDCSKILVPGDLKDDLTLEIYTISGRLVRKEFFQSGDDLLLRKNGLPAGLYLLRAKDSGGGSFSGKFIIH